MYAGIGAGVGAAVGAMIKTARTNSRLVYRAPAEDVDCHVARRRPPRGWHARRDFVVRTRFDPLRCGVDESTPQRRTACTIAVPQRR